VPSRPTRTFAPTARASGASQSRGQTSLSHLGAARQPRQLRTDGTPTPAHRLRAAAVRTWPGRGTQASLPPRRAVTDRAPSGRGRQPPAGLAPFGDLGDLPGQAYAPTTRASCSARPGPPGGRRSHQQALALFSDRSNRLGHAKALTHLGELSPGRQRQSRPPNRCHPQVPGQGPCRNSGWRTRRPPGHAAPELVLPARRCRPASERPCSACRTQERFSAQTTRRPRIQIAEYALVTHRVAGSREAHR
jgi:hypothetical protein